MLAVFSSTTTQAQNCLPNSIGSSGSITLASSLPPTIITNGNITGKQFSFAGTLLLDIDLTISNSVIEMQPNANIEVPERLKLELINTKITSCGNGTGAMWKGITMACFSTIHYARVEIKQGSTIEDAYIGVHTKKDPNQNVNGIDLLVDGATFNTNFIDIKINTSQSTILNHYNLNIQNSRFICLKTNGQYTNLHLSNRRKYIAIEIDSVSSSPQQSGGTAVNIRNNFIDYCDYGIKVKNSKLWVENNTIMNNEYGYFTEQDSYQDIKKCTFKNARIAGVVGTYFAGVNVTDSYFDNTRRGVYLYDVVISCIVKNNEFKNTSNYAIYGLNYYYNSNSAQEYIFSDNKITNGNCGIYLAQIAPTSSIITPADIHIDNNTMRNVKKGIELINLNAIGNGARSALGNTIQIKGDSPYDNGTGISLQNCAYFNVIDNKIVGGTAFCSTVASTKGVVIENSPDCVVQCNSVDMLNKGFSYNGNTQNTNFTQNTMLRCRYQFYLYNNPQGIGNQARNGTDSRNVFTKYTNLLCNDGYFNTYSFFSNRTPNSVNFTKFYYNYSNSAPFINGLEFSTTQMYYRCQPIFINTASVLGCNDQPEPPSPENLKEYLHAEYPEQQATLSYLNQRYGYATLQHNPELQVSFAAEYNKLQNSNVGYWYDAQQVLNNPSANIDSLEKELSNLFADNPAEENYRLLLPLQIANRKGTKPTPTDLQTLTDIANQCPYQGGDAVYTARVLYHAHTDSLIDYDQACSKYDAQVANSSGIQKQVLTKIVTLSQDNVLYLYHHQNLPISVGLYDIQGKLLHTYAQSLYHIINLNNYAAGMYFLQISNEYDELIETLKANAVR
jgi:hypothetical protein